MRDHAIIVAAGKGSRMNSPLPKQFIEVAGKPILAHTLEKFNAFNPKLNLLVVLHPDYVSVWEDLRNAFQINIAHTVVKGGEQRFHSVRNALLSIEDESGIVAIHDAVRPFVGFKTLETCFAAARTHCNAIPALTVDDSLRVVNNKQSSSVDRTAYRIVQTPQCFELSLIRRAYSQPYSNLFTDDASVLESLGEPIHLVHGNRENFKITYPEDLRLAEVLFSL